MVSKGSPTLVLVPTALEREGLERDGPLAPGRALVETLGFGPLAAAARAAARLERLRPARVVLIGVAGTFDPVALPVGSAHEFAAVGSIGVGAGSGPAPAGPRELGFPQAVLDGRGEVWERLELQPLEPARAARLLLTACAASGSADDARARRARWPEADAEDLEAFGLALACAAADVPLTVVRGISNEVGDRDVRRWRIGPALAAARCRLGELFERARHAEDGA